MLFILVIYSLSLAYALVRYSRHATHHINALRSDVDTLEQRLAQVEATLTGRPGSAGEETWGNSNG